MGSATRTATARVNTAFAELGQQADLQLADELFSVSLSVNSSKQLQSLFVDPAIPENQKHDLIAKLFPTLSKNAQSLLAVIVGSPWSKRRDIVEAIESTGIQAASVGQSRQVVQELFSIAEVVAANAELELALNDKLANPVAKAELVTKLFGAQVSAAPVQIVSALVQQPRGRRFRKQIDSAAQQVATAGGFKIAKVTSATALSAAQIQDIENNLGASEGQPVLVIPSLDADAIGGIRIQIGQEVLDGTLEARLNELKLQLTK